MVALVKKNSAIAANIIQTQPIRHDTGYATVSGRAICNL